MFIPMILTDAAAQKVSNKPAWCTAVAFTTNIAFFPFLALRAAPEPPAPAAGGPAAAAAARPKPRRPAPGGTQAVGAWGRGAGAFGLAACALSAAWALWGRPELGGDLAQRAAYFQQEFSSNRVRRPGGARARARRASVGGGARARCSGPSLQRS
jgi:hypothetical protein